MTVDGRARRYVVYVPHEYRASTAWPLIVFLHGRGERGDDGLRQSNIGIGFAIRKWPERFPALVVMPQCSKETYWDGALDDIESAYQQTVNEYEVDQRRIYLTGLSMGGFGCWRYGARYPGRFAAVIAVCGGGRQEEAEALARTPSWLFHGSDDLTVPVEESRRMVRALENAGGRPKYTEFPGVGHFSWDQTYGDPKVTRWLFKQRLKT